MILECLPIGMFSSNCYIIGENGEGVIIDAGGNSEEIYKAVEKHDLKAKYIILTHGHVDHICSASKLREKTGAKVLIHEADGGALTDADQNGSYLLGREYTFEKADELLKDGDIIEVGGLKLEIIHTPGHTLGCICIKVGDSLFTGDTLFRMSIGRTDFEGGSYEQIISSINKKLMKLGDETAVYPGHGTPSTIGFERKNNPFLKYSEESI